MLLQEGFIEEQIQNSAPLRRFQRQALANLAGADRLLFEAFGQGPIVRVPETHIHHVFEKFAAIQPDAIAATCEGTFITYEELNRQAERLALLLIELDVKPGDNVALFLQRSIPMLVGILATLKAGAAYVPQDVRLTPEPALRHILNATGAKVILTLSSLVDFLPDGLDGMIVAVDEFTDQDNTIVKLHERSILNKIRERAQADDCCFVLFTSGTTGLPNGVKVTHKNLCNILLTEPGDMGMKPGMRVSQILNIAFDMAAWEILGALSHGSTLLIRGKDIQETVELADIVIATPSILGKLDASRCRNVKAVAVAGEPCPKPLADLWSEFATFYNSCGPTEVTIVNTMQKYRKETGRLTIGKPTPNNTVYILDENLQPCGIGDIGEMWAGGDCVSLEYIANPDLTNERYKPDPFLGGHHRMFRTRDLGRWTMTGELEHFGRTDDQVKIRGFRVELDSVSNALETVSGCTQAVTLKLDDRNLVAFVRPAMVDLAAAKETIAQRLPYYCVPSLILSMDEFPTTSRGKIDKRALTIMAVNAQEKQTAKTETEVIA